MSPVQMGLLAASLSLLVYYLTMSTACSQAQQGFFGTPLQAADTKHHVLVTGGSGYIGSHATKRLLEDGHAVTVVDNLSRGNLGAIRILQRIAKPGRFQFIEADLGDSHAVLQIFNSCRVDLVMHFAAVAYVGESIAEPLRYYRNVTANTVNLLEAMRATSVKQLVFSSTCATYGNPQKLPVTEDSATVPVNPYGSAKLMAETAIRDYAAADPSLRAVIFRYFNVYGSDTEGLLGEWPRPELRTHSRISGACLDAAMGDIDSLTITGTNHATRDGTCVRDFIHVADLVDAHLLGMSALANPPALYNVATGKGVTVREFVTACLKVTGADIRVTEQERPRPGDYAEMWADPSKIRQELGWQAKFTNVEEGLAHAWKWRRRNPTGYA